MMSAEPVQEEESRAVLFDRSSLFFAAVLEAVSDLERAWDSALENGIESGSLTARRGAVVARLEWPEEAYRYDSKQTVDLKLTVEAALEHLEPVAEAPASDSGITGPELLARIEEWMIGNDGTRNWREAVLSVVDSEFGLKKEETK